MNEGVVSILNITQTSAPAPEDAIYLEYMDDVEIQPSISLTVIFARYPNLIGLISFKKGQVSASFSVDRKAGGNKKNEKQIEEDGDVSSVI